MHGPIYEAHFAELLGCNRHLMRSDSGPTGKVILPEKQIEISPKVADL